MGKGQTKIGGGRMSAIVIAGWIVGSALALVAIAAALTMRPDIPREQVVRAYSMPDSRFLTLKDGSVAHVRISGSGPPLVLLPGFSSSTFAWDGWARTLADRYQLIRIDAPGHGLTAMAANADLSPSGGTAFLIEIIDALGLDAVAIAGNSMGGGQAWRLAALHPDRVTALILVDSAGPTSRRVDGDIARVRRAAANPLLRTALLYGGGELVMAQALKSGVHDPKTISPDDVRRTDQLYRAAGNRAVLLRSLEARASDPVAARPADIRAPTLIMQGAEDRLVPPDVARALAADIPGARLIIYPGLGHTPHQEAPEKTAGDAGAFLDAVLGDKPGERRYMDGSHR